ncbi:MAG: non-ribosomal peptide synthetase, partial [Acidimicrobiales bacterium]
KHGPLDLGAFRDAFNEIVRRHDAWHTSFDSVDGKPVQIIHPAPSHELPVLDLSHLTEDGAERQAVRIASDMSMVPYDIRRGPLLRPRLIRFPDHHHRLYLALHHLVFDGVSVYRVILPELVTLYDAFRGGRPSPLPDAHAQYGDFARWEQRWITEARATNRMAHWRRHLFPPPVVSLPLDHPRPEVRRFRGGVVPVSMNKDTVDQLREVGRSRGATLFQVLATIWSVLLARYTGEPEVAFATAADLRQRPEFESVVGYCLTPIVLRVNVRDDIGFADLIVDVRNEVLDGLDHLLPFERLVRQLPPEQGSSANPIYQTMLVLEPPAIVPNPSWSIHQMENGIGEMIGSAKLDLELELDERPEGHIEGRLIYDRDLFEAGTGNRVADHWMRIVALVAADPRVICSTIPILTSAEEEQLAEWNATATEVPHHKLHEIVHVRAIQCPEAPAVDDGEDTVSYAELDCRAGRIADSLNSTGVTAGDVVGVCSEPSVELIVGLLGILKAGAAYLLLDPDLPAAQTELMVLESRAAAVLASPALTPRLSALPVRVLPLRRSDVPEPGAPTTSGQNASDAVFCLQYTASRASRPNGVLVRHASVVNLVNSLAAKCDLGPSDAVLVLPKTLFDFPALEIWLALAAGARIVLATAEVASDGARVSRLIASQKVTFVHAAPSTWRQLIDTGLRGARGLKVLSGGERLSDELAHQLLDRCRVLWNGYGSIETAEYSTLARAERSVPVTIGSPIANTRVYVVDRRRGLVPVCVTGELLIAGDGVASGYLHRPELTAEAFVDDPFGPGMAYRTGQLARWRPDGRLEHMGWSDGSKAGSGIGALDWGCPLSRKKPTVAGQSVPEAKPGEGRT